MTQDNKKGGGYLPFCDPKYEKRVKIIYLSDPAQ